MKIAVLISNLFKLPPRAEEIIEGFSGAPENISWQITEELVRRGHNVSLFASGDSYTKAKLYSVSKHASALDKNIGLGKHVDYEYFLINKLITESKKQKFDIIHSHIPERIGIFSKHFDSPVVSTLHSPLSINNQLLLNPEDKQYLVSISNAQRKPLPSLNYISTVYHGINISNFPYHNSSRDDMVFVGRIVPEKGLHTAFEIAHKLNKVLSIYGDSPNKDGEYYQKKILPKKERSDQFYGFQNQDKIKKAMQFSKLFIFPIEWEEPFGLVMIEAMACGTPVVAFNRGSVSEIIKDGETGFIVKPGDVKGMTKAVERIYNMPEDEYLKMRQNCRKHVEENFTIKKMVDGYEKVYQRIINKWRK